MEITSLNKKEWTVKMNKNEMDAFIYFISMANICENDEKMEFSNKTHDQELCTCLINMKNDIEDFLSF